MPHSILLDELGDQLQDIRLSRSTGQHTGQQFTGGKGPRPVHLKVFSESFHIFLPQNHTRSLLLTTGSWWNFFSLDKHRREEGRGSPRSTGPLGEKLLHQGHQLLRSKWLDQVHIGPG